MEYTNRSLWLAVLACLAMGLFAKSPGFAGDQTWITGVFFFATFLLSGVGLWFGIKGARRLRNLWGWLAVFINAFIFLAFLSFSILLYQALSKFQ